MNKKIVDGKVAVIICEEFGWGWYSTHHIEELVYDPYVVDLILSDDEDKVRKIEEYCWLQYGGPYRELYTADYLTVDWVDVGSKFKIHDYDGLEQIVLEKQQKWFIA